MFNASRVSDILDVSPSQAAAIAADYNRHCQDNDYSGTFADFVRWHRNLTETKERAETQAIFVYGTLRKCQGNHRLLKSGIDRGGAAFVCNARTAIPCALYNLGYYPALAIYTPGNRDLTENQVVGEVYNVDAETLRQLDILEGEGHHYHRVPISVVCEDGRTLFVQTYAMSGSRLSGYPRIKSGDWVAYREQEPVYNE